MSADLKAGSSSAAAVASRVPTVTLISHRELRDKHGAHRFQPGSLDLNLVAGSHYRCSEGRSWFYEVFRRRVNRAE